MIIAYSPRPPRAKLVIRYVTAPESGAPKTMTAQTLCPVDEADRHRGTGPAAFRCSFFEIPELVAEAKYREVS